MQISHVDSLSLRDFSRLNIQVNALHPQSPQSFPPNHMENRKTRITRIDVQSNRHHIASPLRNKEASINCMLGLGGGGLCSLMPPNNTPVYSVLGLPLLNTFLTFQRLHSIQKSAKRDPRRLFSPPLGGGTHTMIP